MFNFVVYFYFSMAAFHFIFFSTLLFKYRKRHLLTQKILADEMQAHLAPVKPSGVSIIIPAKGVLPSFLKNLVSLIQQDYQGHIEIIVAVKDESDPMVKFIKDFHFKNTDLRSLVIVAGGHDAGLNPKNSNLFRGFSKAKYEWIYLSDADIFLNPTHVRECVFAVKGNSKNYATAFTLNIGAENLGAKLESIGANYESPMFFLASALKRKFDIMSGGSMFFHKDLLKKAGGLEICLNTLTDDLVFGNAFSNAGEGGKLLSQPAIENLKVQTFKAYRNRMVRWILIAKCFRPVIFAVAPFFWHWQWLLLASIISQNRQVLALTGAAMLLRVLGAMMSMLLLGSPKKDLSKVWVIFIYDFFVPINWIEALFRREVEWNGNKLVLKSDGTLVPSLT